CMFRGTNGSSRHIACWVIPEAKGKAGWYPTGATVYNWENSDEILAGQTFTFCLNAPAKGSTWRLSLFYHPMSWTKWERRRYECADFFHEKKMPAIGHLIFREPPASVPGPVVLGPEIHE